MKVDKKVVLDKRKKQKSEVKTTKWKWSVA